MITSARGVRPRPNLCPAPAATTTARRAARGRVVAVRALDDTGLASAFAHAPKEAWIALGSVVAGMGAIVASALTGGGAPSAQPAAAPEAAAPARPTTRNAVAVFGASGKTGRAAVAALLAAGRDVVAAVRDEARAVEALASVGVEKAGTQPNGATLAIVPGIDVTSPATLDPSNAALWAGVSQAVLALGPVVGRTPEGGPQTDGNGGAVYLNGATPEAVDAKGVEAVAAAIAAALPGPPIEAVLAPSYPVVLPMGTGPDLDAWERLDDVIMGGASESVLEPAGPEAADSAGAVWRGVLRYEGGGFCGARTRPGLALDLTGAAGLALRVKGDGQTFKLNVKTADQVDVPEAVYQALVPTVAGDWTTVRLPWSAFVATKRARYDPAAPPLDPAAIRQLGLVLSRFEFDGAPNPRCKPGPFELEIDGGVRSFKEAAPVALLLTSAAIERNARIGDDAAARAKEIPIVRLNPGGALNYKYMGESAFRRTLPGRYAVIRMTGLTTENEDTLFPLELRQGDEIAGTISRAEVGRLVAGALATPAAAGKTVEARRGVAADAVRLGAGTPAEAGRLWSACVIDSARPTVGLPPMPAPVPPPPPPSADVVKEVLADPRVAAAAAAGRGGRVRDAAEVEAAETITPAEAVRGAVTDAQQGQGSDTAAAATETADVPANVADAREWVRAWRARTLEKALPAGAKVDSE